MIQVSGLSPHIPGINIPKLEVYCWQTCNPSTGEEEMGKVPEFEGQLTKPVGSRFKERP